jgi:predicted metal-dependent peptidase
LSGNAPDPAATLARIQRGLRLVTVPFPHLAGLAAAARVTLDERVPTMGVFASGRMVANPAFAAKLKDSELVFVLAHEMLHLALRTHDRAKGADRLAFNYAHDYIINDILRGALGFTYVPANGLDMPGAKDKSAERILIEMRRDAAGQSRTQVWDGQPIAAGRLFGPGAGQGAGRGGDGEPGDVLADDLERELYPDDAAAQAAHAARMRAAAEKAMALAHAMGTLRGVAPGSVAQEVAAARGTWRTPWEQGLQRWLESVAPGERTFVKPSRRGAERADVVLPGRRREGWMLNVVLDTSGSMAEEIPHALGAIADFCDAAGIDEVRLVQCDAAVTADARIAPQDLGAFRVSGYGGSDVTPALAHLAEDAQVQAVVVITDGDIGYPDEAPPYAVLWIVPPAAAGRFAPPYGRVLQMETRP